MTLLTKFRGLVPLSSQATKHTGRSTKYCTQMFCLRDSFGKFLQQMPLWMEMKPSKWKSNADEVCGTVNDTDMLITTIGTPQQELKTISSQDEECESISGDSPTASRRTKL